MLGLRNFCSMHAQLELTQAGLYRYLALAGVGTFVLTHLLFLFVIFLPWICAINPNVRLYFLQSNRRLELWLNFDKFAAWRDSRPLSMVVPVRVFLSA